jgi:hypothetical protein
MAQNGIAVCAPGLSSLPQTAGHTEPPVQFGRFVLIDGLNIVRLHGASPKPSHLLTIVLHVARVAPDFACVFDANTRYVLQDSHRLADVQGYQYLLRRHGSFFVEVTGGTRADDVILAEADARSAIVVSNDRFQKYDARYPWTKSDTRILRVNNFRNYLHFSDRRFAVRDNLRALIDEFESLLYRPKSV